MMQGRWRDTLISPDGTARRRTPWRSNLIVDGAFSLVAGLLARDRELDGILYWAVGEGDEAWDEGAPATEPGTTRLARETDRRPVAEGDVRFVEEDGDDASGRTAHLEIRLAFTWERPVVLREFGLFGGDAREGADSGVMVNHVIHERIELEAGQRLDRELRLSLGRSVDRRWVEVAPHWIGDEPVRRVDGVGELFAAEVARAGFTTVGALATAPPAGGPDGVPRVRFAELRAKARLALRTLPELRPLGRLQRFTVSEVLRTPPERLADEAGVFEDDVVRLREQLATLELALDHRFLGPLTVGEVARQRRRGGRPVER